MIMKIMMNNLARKLGYINQKEVIRLISKGQAQLSDKKLELIELLDSSYTGQELEDWKESYNKLEGGVYFLDLLKKHFK